MIHGGQGAAAGSAARGPGRGDPAAARRGWPVGRGVLLLGALVLLAHLALPRPDLRPPSGAIDRYLDGRSFRARPAQAEPVFRDATTGAPVPAAAGAIFAVNDAVKRHFRGTYLGGDAWTGVLRGEPFAVDAPFLYLPVAGYPASAGNRLELCLLDAAGNVVRRIAYAGNNPREALGMWELDTREFRGTTARIELTDGLPTPTGWLGVGRPLLAERGGLGGRGPGDFGGETGGTNAAFWWAALVIAALLWLPGMALGVGRLIPKPPRESAPQPEDGGGLGIGRPTFADAAWLALPGLLGLTALGLVLWLTGLGKAFLLTKLYVAAVALTALGAARRASSSPAPSANNGGRLALAVYAGVVFVVLQFSVVPLTVERESFAGSNQRGRMVCSPPDNVTPYATGAYLFHGHDGRHRAALYFGEGWTLTSRGPLVPLGVTALFSIFNLVPPDPPQSGEYAWPADEQGFYLARIFGVLTNALVVLAVAALAAQIAPAGSGGRAGTFALGWAALCPLTFVNVAYVWPKLLAATFALLAAGRVLAGAGGAWGIGGLLALGYYAHPIGALLAPGVVALRAAVVGRVAAESSTVPADGSYGTHVTHGSHGPERRVGRWSSLRRLIPAAGLAAAFVACLLPWLAFKRHVGGPETFVRYPLGDGRGYQDAVSLTSWARARVDNVWFTLVPAAFHFSDGTPEWFEAPLRGPSRWNMAYSKSLPGHLGYGAFWVAYAAVFAWAWRRVTAATGGTTIPPAARDLRNWGVLATLAGMVLIWGFNSDGLGRNCLEGLSPFALALGAAWAGTAVTFARDVRGRNLRWRLGALVLTVVALETAWVMFSGFGMERRFQAAGLPLTRWAQLGALGLTWAGVLALVLVGWRAAGRKRVGELGTRAVRSPGGATRPVAVVERSEATESANVEEPRSGETSVRRGGLPASFDLWVRQGFAAPRLFDTPVFPWPRQASTTATGRVAPPGLQRPPASRIPHLASGSRFPWAVLALVAFVLFTRRPDQWVSPQFWAEDAEVLFNQAWSLGWESVFRPYPAYFALYQRLAAGAANLLFPAAWAPAVYAGAALAATLLAATFILRARLPFVNGTGKVCLALALVMVPHGGEVFGTLINAQWLLAPTLWVLILQESARTRREAAGDFAMLAVAGLTGPFIVLFAPGFLWRWRRSGWRRPYDFWLVVVAGTLAAIQAGAIFQHGPVAHAPLAREVGPWLQALGMQLPGGLFLGAHVPRHLGWGPFVVLTPLLLGTAAWALARAERQRAGAALVVLGGGLLCYASGMFQVGGQRPDLLSAFGVGTRYFYPFYVAAAWAAVFLWQDRNGMVRRLAAGAGLAMLLASASAWTAPALANVDWGQYARRLEAGETGLVVPVNPAGWSFKPGPRHGGTRGQPSPTPPTSSTTPRAEGGAAFTPGGVYPDTAWLDGDGPHPPVWGSWNAAAGGDAATGKLSFGPFPAPGRFQISVAGYPNSGGNRLILRRVRDGAERPLVPFEPRERWTEFVVATPRAWAGEPVEVVAEDAATGPAGWFGVSAPYQRGVFGGVRPVDDPGLAGVLPGAWRRDARVLGAFAVNAVLLLLPGLALLGPVRRRLGPGVVADSFAPLAVFALSALTGYALFFVYWLSPAWGTAASVAVCLVSAGALWRVGVSQLWTDVGGAEAGRAGLLTLLAAVLYLGVLLLPRGGGDGVGALAARRFLGHELPSDNLVPELFAAKLAIGSDTRTLLGDWQGSDRPPLGAGWGLLARPVARALGPGGETADQTAGILLQLAWVPAAWALARAAGLNPGRATQVVAAVVPTGLLCVNSVYIWPKLAAAAFTGGAFTMLCQGNATGRNLPTGRAVAAGVLAALGYLAHGGVAFSLLAVAGLLVVLPGLWPGWRRTALGLAAAVSVVLPWLVYVKFYNPPGDRLLKWHLGGVLDPADGRRAGETIRDAYLKTPPAEILAMKTGNALSLFRGDYPGLFNLRGGAAAENRRTEDFFHVVRTLGVWNVGWFVGAGLLSWRAWRRLRGRKPAPSPTSARELGRVAAAVVGGLAVWVLLYFNPPGFSTLDVHYGSYLVLTQALVLLAVILRETSGRMFAVVAGINLLLFLTTYLPPGRMLGGSVDALAVTLAGLAAVGLVLAAALAQRQASPSR